jgi:arginase
MRRKVKIFGVPIDFGAKPLGVEMGPAAIRHAGLHEALALNDIEFEDYGDLNVAFGANENSGLEQIAQISENLGELVREAIREGYTPVILGGDHSASIGSVAGAAGACNRLGLLWLDCHPDANTPETSPSGNIHGMTVAISLGHGHARLVGCLGGGPKVLSRNVSILGAKDIDREEREFIARENIAMFTLSDIQKEGVVQVLEKAIRIISDGTDGIHVSFDVDVMDPVIAPGTGIVSRGGLSYREIAFIMEELGKRGAVSSFDIIEINPLLDIRNQTAELAVELLLLTLGGTYGDYERSYLRNNSDPARVGTI